MRRPPDCRLDGLLDEIVVALRGRSPAGARTRGGRSARRRCRAAGRSGAERTCTLGAKGIVSAARISGAGRCRP
ncbi:MAG: hypothetical protein MZW92_34170 [Comamonadaceae bacterium]|nr:hypothetical protein [Comamonadaceae bacterium]